MKKISILDIGCGTGNGMEIVPIGNYYIGADLSYNMLFHMRERFKSRAIQADAFYIPLKDVSIDLVLATGILEYQKDMVHFLKCITAPLKKGGNLFLTSSPPKWYNSLRRINGAMLWPRSSNYVITTCRENNLTCIDSQQSLLQEQFLFVKE